MTRTLRKTSSEAASTFPGRFTLFPRTEQHPSLPPSPAVISQGSLQETQPRRWSWALGRPLPSLNGNISASPLTGIAPTVIARSGAGSPANRSQHSRGCERWGCCGSGQHRPKKTSRIQLPGREPKVPRHRISGGSGGSVLLGVGRSSPFPPPRRVPSCGSRKDLHSDDPSQGPPNSPHPFRVSLLCSHRAHPCASLSATGDSLFISNFFFLAPLTHKSPEPPLHNLRFCSRDLF